MDARRGMTGVARAAGFYDRAYASADLRAWRELGARGKGGGSTAIRSGGPTV
ncbi:MAG: hypothetical protein NVS2B6_16360 [Thermoleophilaceae bacterium]